MAQSTKYINQQNDLQADLLKCKNYIDTLNDFMATEIANVSMLQSQLDLIDTQIQALQQQINLLDTSTHLSDFIYVKPSVVFFAVTPNVGMTQTFGLSGKNRVYLYADKTVSGLKIDGVDVVRGNSSTYFHSIDAYPSGQNIKVACNKVSAAQNVSVYFSNSSTWKASNPPDKCLGVQIRMMPQIVVPVSDYVRNTSTQYVTTQ